MLTTLLMTAALNAALACDARPLVIGHRGSGASNEDNPFAENTVASVSNAFAEGAEYAEIDVQLASDGVVVLHHDFTLDETTSLKGCLADHRYAQLATADATVGSGAAEPAAVARFSDVLAAAKKAGGKINIEMKVNEGGECPATDIPALVAATVADVEAAGMAGEVFVSSFSFAALEEVKRVKAEIPVGFLTAEGGDELLADAARAEAAGFEAVNPIFFTVSEDAATLAALQETSLAIYPWTVNDPAFIRKLLDAGVDGVITDDVPAALAAREAAMAACVEEGEGVVEAETGGGCASGGDGATMLVLAVAALAAGRRKKAA